MKGIKALGGLLCVLGCIVALAGILATAAPMVNNSQVQSVIDSFSVPSDNRILSTINALALFCLAQNYLIFVIGIVTLLAGGLMRTGAERALYKAHTDAPEAEPAENQTPEVATPVTAQDEDIPAAPVVEEKRKNSAYGTFAIPSIPSDEAEETEAEPNETAPVYQQDAATAELIAHILKEEPTFAPEVEATAAAGETKEASLPEEPAPETQTDEPVADLETLPIQEPAEEPNDISVPEETNEANEANEAEPIPAISEFSSEIAPDAAVMSQAAPSEPEAEPYALTQAASFTTPVQPMEAQPAMTPLRSVMPAREDATPRPLDSVLTARRPDTAQGENAESAAPVHAEWSYHPAVAEHPTAPTAAPARKMADTLNNWETLESTDERMIVATRKPAVLPKAEAVETAEKQPAPPTPQREPLQRPPEPSRFHKPDLDVAAEGEEPTEAPRPTEPSVIRPDERPNLQLKTEAEADTARDTEPAPEIRPKAEPEPRATPERAIPVEPSRPGVEPTTINRPGRPKIVTTMRNLQWKPDEPPVEPSASPAGSETIGRAAPALTPGDTDRPRIISTLGKKSLR